MPEHKHAKRTAACKENHSVISPVTLPHLWQRGVPQQWATISFLPWPGYPTFSALKSFPSFRRLLPHLDVATQLQLLQPQLPERTTCWAVHVAVRQYGGLSGGAAGGVVAHKLLVSLQATEQRQTGGGLSRDSSSDTGMPGLSSSLHTLLTDPIATCLVRPFSKAAYHMMEQLAG